MLSLWLSEHFFFRVRTNLSAWSVLLRFIGCSAAVSSTATDPRAVPRWMGAFSRGGYSLPVILSRKTILPGTAVFYFLPFGLVAILFISKSSDLPVCGSLAFAVRTCLFLCSLLFLFVQVCTRTRAELLHRKITKFPTIPFFYILKRINSQHVRARRTTAVALFGS